MAEGTPSRPSRDDVTGCLITLEYGDRRTLVVALDRDGSINRMGDGTMNPADDTWYIGHTDEPLFEQLIQVVPKELLELSGRYEPADRRGVECRCRMLFQHREGTTGLDLIWGSESQGVPTQVHDVLVRALELTGPWWKAQPRDPNVRFFGGTEPRA